MKYAGILVVLIIIFGCQDDEKKPKPERTKLPSVAPKPDILRDDRNAIHIRLGAGEEILVEGNSMHISGLKQALKTAKNNKGDTATVVMFLQGDTQYGVFAEVHETLEELLNSDRDSIAKLRFDTPFNDLNETQRALITRKYHHRIIEKMKR